MMGFLPGLHMTRDNALAATLDWLFAHTPPNESSHDKDTSGQPRLQLRSSKKADSHLRKLKYLDLTNV